MLERVYRNLDLSQRRLLIARAFSDSFYVDIVNTVNDRLLGNGQVSSNSIDFSQMMDIGALTAGMPEKYAELLNLHLPIGFQIDLRYNLGLSDFREGPGTFRSRVVQLSFARVILKFGG